MRCASLHLHSNEADDNFTVDKARYRSIIRSNCLFCTALGNCVALTDRIDQLIKETVPRTNYRCPYYNERLIIVPLCLCFHRRFGVRFVVTQHNPTLLCSHLICCADWLNTALAMRYITTIGNVNNTHIIRDAVIVWSCCPPCRPNAVACRVAWCVVSQSTADANEVRCVWRWWFNSSMLEPNRRAMGRHNHYRHHESMHWRCILISPSLLILQQKN